MSQIRKPIKADAILWDFDGTLADSAPKNIAITKQILARVAPRLTGESLPRALQSKAAYHVANHGADNWRDLYRHYFHMNDEEIEQAGPLWESYQIRNGTIVSLFEGVVETIRQLSSYPLGICSANATSHITKVLDEHGIGSAFRSVIGYEKLPEDEQKPAPDGGLKCLDEIFGQTGGKTIIYVGDHIADVLFARRLDERLGPSSTVISVVTTHSGARPELWPVQPDVVISHPSNILTLVSG